jgi:hypothetical protein
MRQPKVLISLRFAADQVCDGEGRAGIAAQVRECFRRHQEASRSPESAEFAESVVQFVLAQLERLHGDMKIGRGSNAMVESDGHGHGQLIQSRARTWFSHWGRFVPNGTGATCIMWDAVSN